MWEAGGTKSCGLFPGSGQQRWQWWFLGAQNMGERGIQGVLITSRQDAESQAQCHDVLPAREGQRGQAGQVTSSNTGQKSQSEQLWLWHPGCVQSSLGCQVLLHTSRFSPAWAAKCLIAKTNDLHIPHAPKSEIMAPKAHLKMRQQ